MGNVTTYMGRTGDATDHIKASMGKPVNKSMNMSIPDESQVPIVDEDQ